VTKCFRLYHQTIIRSQVNNRIWETYLWPDDGLVIEAETCCHMVTLNKINIQKLVVFWLVNLYSLFVYIEHNGDESPKDIVLQFCALCSLVQIMTMLPIAHKDSSFCTTSLFVILKMQPIFYTEFVAVFWSIPNRTAKSTALTFKNRAPYI
jgi:hypothetical protein